MLLDTHIFLWWLFDDPKLSNKIRLQILDEDQKIYISSASVWEISTKYRIGKLSHAASVATNVPFWIKEAGFTPLSISPEHAQLAGSLKDKHRDPFDRMLLSQAIIENKILLTEDKTLLKMLSENE